MKALLICPAERSGVTALGQRQPLATQPFLGLSLLEYWLQHLAQHGASRVAILAADRPAQISAHVGDGARWGLEVEVVPLEREPSIDDARELHQCGPSSEWLAAPLDIVVADRLPFAVGAKPFESYADWFAAARDCIPHALTPDRVGWREIRPGIWVGHRARIAQTAELVAPCWIGDDVYIGPEACVGPNAILESRVFVESGACIFDSVIGPDTFIGGITEVGHSLAWGDQLINWLTGSTLRVTEEYLLCSIERSVLTISPTHWVRVKTGTLMRALAVPFQNVLRRASPFPGAETQRPIGSRAP